jgi:hypothetical protein
MKFSFINFYISNYAWQAALIKPDETKTMRRNFLYDATYYFPVSLI